MFGDMVDDILPAPDCKKLKKHLDECSPCRNEFNTFRISVEALNNLPAVKAPPFFEKRIVASIRDRPDGRRTFSGFPRLAYITGAIVILLLFTRTSGPPDIDLPLSDHAFSRLSQLSMSDQIDNSEYLSRSTGRIWSGRYEPSEIPVEWVTGDARIVSGYRESPGLIWRSPSSDVSIVQASYDF